MVLLVCNVGITMEYPSFNSVVERGILNQRLISWIMVHLRVFAMLFFIIMHVLSYEAWICQMWPSVRVVHTSGTIHA